MSTENNDKEDPIEQPDGKTNLRIRQFVEKGYYPLFITPRPTKNRILDDLNEIKPEDEDRVPILRVNTSYQAYCAFNAFKLKW